MRTSLTGQPLHKRGRVWSTSHHEFVLQSQQWVSTTMCDQSNSMLIVVNCDVLCVALAGLFSACHTMQCNAVVCACTRTAQGSTVC